MFPLRALILVLVFAAPFAGQASSPQKSSSEWSQARNSLHARMRSLSPFEQKLMVLLVYTDTNENSNSLATSNPKQVTDSVKVLSVEHRLLADLSKEAGWSEMGRWFQGNSDSLVTVARGEKTILQFGKEMELRKIEYQRMVSAFKVLNKDEASHRPSSAFAKLRPELATYVSATARIYTWGRES